MAININKIQTLFRGQSNSWSDFYINMALEMAENVAKSKAGNIVVERGLLDFTGDAEGISNINDNYWFAQSLTEEYDKAIRGGKTLIGGVPIKTGNTTAMLATLLIILNKTQLSKNGDLLRDIGPAIQAYWLGAQTTNYPPPSVPCIGSIRNITTTLGINFSPGIWTPISIPPVNSVSPFLLNFILSASLHLLTVGGIFTCLSQYPPPAPPAPGVLPWVGYFVKPFSGSPLSSLDFKDMVSLAGGLVLTPVLDAVAGDTLDLSVSNLSAQLLKGFVEGGEFQEPQIQAALQSILGGDEPAMLAAGDTIRNNSG
jgi:hypothetical protein